MDLPRTSTSAFVSRRRALLHRLGDGAALIASGLPRSRNFPANRHPFRASSHFLYFLGASIPNAALLFADGEVTLFAPPPSADDALWHGPEPSLQELREAHALDAAAPLETIGAALRPKNGGASRKVATLPTQDAASSAWLSAILDRNVTPSAGADLPEGSADAALAEAMIDLRLYHDDAAIAQLRAAAHASAGAHIAGMRATRAARTEAEVAGAMTGELRRRQLDDAYGPIVTVHGEILHNEHHRNAITKGDLLLADVGGETPEGWAADITRVWPVAGVFSPTQRAIYEVVLAAQRTAIRMARKGTRYRAIHEAAGRAIVEGLRAHGIFRGDVDGLYERGAAAIFFPHGVGHLIGLDVHDMEDLGDRAGYLQGRSRSTRFGDCFLRLDRDLAPRMAVTIEPGFYQVPGILGDPGRTGPLGGDLDRGVLAKFADVRGIRIEDDVLVTEGEPDVLTAAVPKDPAEVEALVTGG